MPVIVVSNVESVIYTLGLYLPVVHTKLPSLCYTWGTHSIWEVPSTYVILARRLAVSQALWNDVFQLGTRHLTILGPKRPAEINCPYLYFNNIEKHHRGLRQCQLSHYEEARDPPQMCYERYRFSLVPKACQHYHGS
jgi:hypothetical protein